MISMIGILAIIGIVLSWYALYVENKAKKNKSYRAACDINDKISCTKAFLSKYGKTFGIPNPAYGIVFYSAILAMIFYGKINIIIYLSAFSVAYSLYLAYLQYFKLRSFCVVCSAIYVVNILVFLLSAALI